MQPEVKCEMLLLWHPDGQEHQVQVCFAASKVEARLGACYVAGSAANPGSLVVEWSAFYESPYRDDPGYAALGEGRIDLEIASLRGIGLGSLLMRPLVTWIKSHSCPVPIMPINLAADDAKTTRERDMRNRFYEKLGFRFDYENDAKSYGQSYQLQSLDLIIPVFRLSRQWQVESVGGAGEVF